MNKKKFLSDNGGWLLSIAVIAIMVMLLFSVRIVHTKGKSMEPTLTEGDVLLVVRDTTPEPGEMFLIKKDNMWMVKRVIAVAGETVPADICPNPYWTDAPAPATVPEGYVFVAGDNRENSQDSRKEYFGLVPVDSFWGRIVFHFGNWNSPAWMEIG